MDELLRILMKTNDRGEIGYAWGGDNADLPLVKECEGRRLIVYSHDASVGYPSSDIVGWLGGKTPQRRDIYKLTERGREMVAKAKAEATVNFICDTSFGGD